MNTSLRKEGADRCDGRLLVCICCGSTVLQVYLSVLDEDFDLGLWRSLELIFFCFLAVSYASNFSTAARFQSKVRRKYVSPRFVRDTLIKMV